MKLLTRRLALGAFSLQVALMNISCQYTPQKFSFATRSQEVQFSVDGKITFEHFPEFVRMQGTIYSSAVKDKCSGMLDIYENHPLHGKVMILESSYGLVDFKAYDGSRENKLDGNPDLLEWKLRNSEKWNAYEVPDGTTPKHWPANRVHEHATSLEFELLETLKKEFGYEVYGEE